MATYLFTWNPARWAWEDKNENLEDDLESYKKRGYLQTRWSSGRTTRIERGDRIFLLRLGPQKPSGIMGSGFALCSPWEDGHWSGESGKTALYVDLRFDVLLHPIREDILRRSFLEEQIQGVHWTPQASGTEVAPPQAAHLEFLWARHLTQIGLSPIEFSEEISAPEQFWEGAVSQITVNAYERNPRARKACISHFGCKCRVCGFDFEKQFGDIGKGFIHVHHVKPISEIDAEYQIDPINDLAPVCPNCHAMLHWHSPPFSCDELRTRREQASGGSQRRS